MFLIFFLVPLIPSNKFYWVRSCSGWVPVHVLSLLDHWRFVKQAPVCAAWELLVWSLFLSLSRQMHHRGLSCLHFCSLCTPQIYSSTLNHAPKQKFSDDSVVVGCIKDGQELEDRDLVDNLVEWNSRNHLLLNIRRWSILGGRELWLSP